jgi:hypothetical protein
LVVSKGQHRIYWLLCIMWLKTCYMLSTVHSAVIHLTFTVNPVVGFEVVESIMGNPWVWRVNWICTE